LEDIEESYEILENIDIFFGYIGEYINISIIMEIKKRL
jgi:hypothetical protein